MILKFNTIEKFISLLKQKVDIVGIVEYGGRKYNDMSLGGDYDLTVIHRLTKINNIGGIHFHIGGIPIDCMLRSIDYFNAPKPPNMFDIVHLNCTILFDRDGSITKTLEKVAKNWALENELSDREINMYRFSFKHIIDKLRYRLHDDKLYSQYFMTASLDWFIECYARILNLEVGKPKLVFHYLKNNDVKLYNYIDQFFYTNNIEIRFDLLKQIAEHMVKDIGGLWRENEIIFHLDNDVTTQKEKDLVLEMLNLV